MPTPLSLSGTSIRAGNRLRFLCFGIVGWIACLAFFTPFAWLSIEKHAAGPVVFALACLLFSAYVLRRFIEDCYFDDRLPPVAGNVAEALSAAIAKRLGMKRRITGSDLLRAACATERGTFLLREIGLDRDAFLRDTAAEVDAEVDVAAFLDDAAKRIPSFDCESRIDANVILTLLFDYVPGCTKALHAADMSREELLELLKWESFHHCFRRTVSPLNPDVIRSTPIGRSWVAGYTNALDALTQEMAQEDVLTGEKQVAIHQPLIQNILQVLERPSQRNALIIGKTGVGKRTLIANAMRALRRKERRQNRPFTRALQLQTEFLLSGVGQMSDAVMLRALRKAQSAGRFVLVIDDFALLLKSASTPLQTVLLKFLQSDAFAVIGVLATADYHAIVKANPQIDSLFQKITVEDSDDDETMRILMAHYFARERQWPRIPCKTARAVVALSKRFLFSQGGFPSTPLQVMEDAVILARQEGTGTVTESHVRAVVSRRGKMNVAAMTSGERERLLALEDVLKKDIIGQDAAVAAVASALKRARLDLHERKKPLGTFLFLGPTGVGKTHTAKTLAREYFGSADSMIRLDMNEYSHPDSVFGIIGSTTGSEKEGILAQRVQDKPFSLILLDEIEKAHPTVLNLFLQILDEGMLTDAHGIQTNFRNVIIIATSNAGALFIRDYVAAHPTIDQKDLRRQLLDKILADKIFAPEFLNRFDDTVVFQPMTADMARRVALLMLADIIADIHRKRGIIVTIQDDALDALAEHGHSVEFGARAMSRTITDAVEDFLADYLLRHEPKRGETIVVRKEDLKW